MSDKLQAPEEETPVSPRDAWTRRQATDDAEYDALAELFLGADDDDIEDVVEIDVDPEPEPQSVTDEPPEIRLVRDDHDDVVDEPVAVEPEPAPVAEPTTRARAPRRVETPLIETLMLGHLPVRSSPWISQYIRARVERSGRPVIHVRVRNGHIVFRLFAPEATPIPAFDAVGHVLSWGAERCRHWILQVDEFNEPTLAMDEDIDCVTLLSGANDAAVVAAYGAIKRLVESAPTENEEGDEIGPPHIQVATMGSDDATANDAFERLCRAASVYLGRDVEHVAHVERMGPTGAQHLFEGEWDERPFDVIRGILNACLDRPGGVDELPPEIIADDADNAAPDQPTVVATEALHVHIDGVFPLDVTPPDHADVELAVDGCGRLHLLRTDHDGRAASTLTAAAAWARKHAAILAKLPGADILDPTGPAVLHVFTDRPVNVRPLLDTDLRIHLRVRTGDAWFSTPLN